MAIAAGDWKSKQSSGSTSHAKAAAAAFPLLKDYGRFLEGSALFEANDHAGAIEALKGVIDSKPESPFLRQAVMEAANSHLALGQAREAVALLRAHFSALPDGGGNLLLAQASEALGDRIAAAVYYQNAFYLYPERPEAELARVELDRLRNELADSYPPPTAQTLLARALRLLELGDAKAARAELEAVLPQLAGKELDLARVRIGVADFRLRNNRPALEHLRSFTVSDPEADAERLFHIHAAARRLKLDDEAAAAVDQLAARYPRSSWRLQALVSAGNEALLRNNAPEMVRYFGQCYRAFGDEPQSAYCHWKVAWDAYSRRDAGAWDLLSEHVAKYPNSDKRPAALYFLGRLSEKQNEFGGAKVFYSAIIAEHGNYYHAMLARKRLGTAPIKSAAPDRTKESWLAQVAKPSRKAPQEFQPNRATQLRIERARILISAGLDELAEGELVYGANRDAQRHVIAMQLAELMQKMGAPDRGIRYIKSLASNYLSLAVEDAPERFWRLAFPMPFQQALETHARANGLDPFLVAALIRQESEFDTKAVSRARAYGLTQILPSTGRDLSRKAGVKGFRADHLFDPELNIKLGTSYLRTLLDQLNGNLEATLASYNGGKSRVLQWMQGGPFEEPAEFVESIPFTETRNYVQIVLRNAELYRRIYGNRERPMRSGL